MIKMKKGEYVKNFEVKLNIRAECEDDAKEMIEEYLGEVTEVEIIKIKQVE